MAQLIYQINSGYPNFTAHIEPNVAPDQIHSSLGVYSFDDIPVGEYSLTITDAIGCEAFFDNITFTTTTTTTSGITGICNYIQSSSTGTVHSDGIDTGIVGDDEYGEISLPFTFRFYNTDYNSIFATTDGYLSFVDPSFADYTFVELPYNNGSGILPMLFPLWTDLIVEPLTGHSISSITEGVTPNQIFTIKYKCSHIDDSTDPLRIIEFEIRLYETTNKIEFVYGAGVEFAIDFYTIGIQKINADFYTQFSYNTNSINTGDLIQYVFDGCNNTTTTTTTICCPLGILYNEDATTATTGDILHGGLYNWFLTQGTGATSISSTDDFDVPTEADIDTLIAFVGGKEVAGIKLKSAGIADRQFPTFYPTWLTPVAEGTNDYGFSAEASGAIRWGSPVSNYGSLSSVFYMWTKDDFGIGTPDSAKCFMLINSQSSIYTLSYFYDNTKYTTYKRTGASIRLVNPNTLLTNGQTGTYIGNDGKAYPTICIGTQEWVQWNLAETQFRDHSLIVREQSLTTWSSLTSGAMNYFGNKIQNVYKDLQICQDGWHVADTYDYAYLDANFIMGGKLKGLTCWNAPNTDASNAYGINILGCGFRTEDGVFFGKGNNTYLRYNDIGYPVGHYKLNYNDSIADFNPVISGQSNTGMTVLLVKNSTTLLAGEMGTYTGFDGKTYDTIGVLSATDSQVREWVIGSIRETKYRDGSFIVEVTDATLWGTGEKGLCVYDNLWNNSECLTTTTTNPPM